MKRTLTILQSAGVAVGILLSVVFLWILGTAGKTRFEEAAIAEGDSYYAVIKGVRVHCKDAIDAHECLDNTAVGSAKAKYLWLGNSQLHAINQRTLRDRNAPELLHQKMRQSHGIYLITFSLPNASLQEQLVLSAYLLPRLRPTGLILPIVFDDLRETGVRSELAVALKDPATRNVLSEFNIGRRLLAQARSTGNEDDDFAGIASTIQEKSERILTTWLSDNWDLWAARPEARGQIFLELYRLRNAVFGIKPTSVRKIIPDRLANNWAALEAIVDFATRKNVALFVYIVPVRHDVTVPYDDDQYAALKSKLMKEFANRPSVRIANLENAVPDSYWGTKASTTLGEEPEYDFMHFQGRGHEALSSAVYEFITTGPRSVQ